MTRIIRIVVILLAVSFSLATPSIAPAQSSKPKVRAITAFVRLDRSIWESQVAEALRILRLAKSQFESSGYEVQTIRITTQPIAELTAGLSEPRALDLLKQFDQLSAKENFIPNVGPGMLHDADDPASMHLLELALSTLPNIEGSAIIADEAGIHWKTIHRTAELVQYVANHSPRSQGTFNFTATAMLKPFGPFFPGSWHTGPGKQFSIGFEGANVVREVFLKDKGNAEAAIQAFTGARFGSSGTLTAARIITTAVKAVPVKQVGYSGLMVPIMEDKAMAQLWSQSAFSIDALLAYSSVCGTGLDTVPLPGDVTLDQLERIFADVASLAVKWNKPLSARLQPVTGKKAGDRTEYDDPFLFNTTIQPLP